MEHRCGTRRVVRLPVVLWRHGSPPVAAEIADISITGLFVKVSERRFAVNQLLGVEVPLPPGCGLSAWRTRALVVRTGPAGIGLLLDQPGPPALLSLLEGLPPARDLPAGTGRASGEIILH